MPHTSSAVDLGFGAQCSAQARCAAPAHRGSVRADIAVLADILADRFPHSLERDEAARRLAVRWAGILTWGVAMAAGFLCGWLAGASGGPLLAAAYLVGAAYLFAWAGMRWAAAGLEPICRALLQEAAGQRRAAAAVELGRSPCRDALLALAAAAERDPDERVRQAARGALAPSVAMVGEEDFRTAGGLGGRLTALLASSPRATALAILECIGRLDTGPAHPAVAQAARRHRDAEVRAAAARLEPALKARAERWRWRETLLRPSRPSTPSLLRPAPLAHLLRPSGPTAAPEGDLSLP